MKKVPFLMILITLIYRSVLTKLKGEVIISQNPVFIIKAIRVDLEDHIAVQEALVVPHVGKETRMSHPIVNIPKV